MSSRLLPLRLACLLSTLAPATTAAPTTDLRSEARAALDRAIAYYHAHVSSHGGYVYFTSTDLQQRWGEGTATKDQIFVQPPGTPAVGEAFLCAYAATKNPKHLAAARDAGLALAHGQLKSGGWAQVIDFDPNGSKAGQYRNNRGNPKGRNHTSLDDNQTQAAIAFLAHLDRALAFKDPVISDTARTALDALLAAQFPNGAFPQGFTGPVEKHPILRASYPPDWPRIWPNEPYWNYYTLNDGLAGSVSATLLTAIEVYEEWQRRPAPDSASSPADNSARAKPYTAALKRLGDFLLLAQMPAPQPAWCQQYNFAMHPVWARKFEPPALSGLESEDAIRTLLKIHAHTGDKKYLEPIPRALAYLKPKRQPDGLVPRYFELHTDRPLYMNRTGQNYFLTHDDNNLPSHYGWKQPTKLAELERAFSAASRHENKPSPPARRAPSESRIREILASLDAEGRWISTYAGERLVGQPKFAPGFRYLDSTVFIQNIETLAAFLNP